VVALVVLTMFIVPVSPSLWTVAGASPPTIIASLRPLHVLRPLTRLGSSNGRPKITARLVEWRERI
jgi:hypothetical protein